MKKKFKEVCSNYLEKNGWETDGIHRVRLNYDMAVVIPCHNEEDILTSISTLLKADRTNLNLLIIVVINASENATDAIKSVNYERFKELNSFQLTQKQGNFHLKVVLENELPDKIAGVGLARKIGMDLAVRIFLDIDKDGIICCFDADSQCQPNYFIEMYKAFHSNDAADAASIHFEHPLEGDSFSPEIYRAILLYELHLRYYIQIQKWIGLPFAFQTIGSSMAVKASSYCLYGGMNKRKAGEDFYFLQKFISKGSFIEIKSTIVIPSPRISDRVPFGTGKAVNEIVHENDMTYLTYHPQIFIELKTWMTQLKVLYQEGDFNNIKNSRVQGYFIQLGFAEKLQEIKMYTKDFEGFKKRFFQWFDAFALMKLAHYFRDHYYTSIPIHVATDIFLDLIGNVNQGLSEYEKLLLLRQIDKSEPL